MYAFNNKGIQEKQKFSHQNGNQSEMTIYLERQTNFAGLFPEVTRMQHDAGCRNTEYDELYDNLFRPNEILHKV